MSPGGGGYGNPRERAPERAAEDRLSGLVTGDGAPPVGEARPT